MEKETQILSGTIVDIMPLERDDERGGIRWFIVKTNASNAGDEAGELAFSCFTTGHNARHLGELEKGQYVEVEGTLIIEMVSKCESNIWFDVKNIDYEPKKMKRL